MYWHWTTIIDDVSGARDASYICPVGQGSGDPNASALAEFSVSQAVRSGGPSRPLTLSCDGYTAMRVYMYIDR